MFFLRIGKLEICIPFHISLIHLTSTSPVPLILSSEMWYIPIASRSHWSRGLRRGTAAARTLGLRVRIPPGTWISVSCKCCVMSGRGLCVGLITRPENSDPNRCVWVWPWSVDDETQAHWGAVSSQKYPYRDFWCKSDYHFRCLGQFIETVQIVRGIEHLQTC
jgi:hypothetical protein